jgi:hypothetical protein
MQYGLMHGSCAHIEKLHKLHSLSHTCVKSGFLIGLEQVSLSSNSTAFRQTHTRNCLRCNNNNKYGGQDLADKHKL